MWHVVYQFSVGAFVHEYKYILRGLYLSEGASEWRAVQVCRSVNRDFCRGHLLSLLFIGNTRTKPWNVKRFRSLAACTFTFSWAVGRWPFAPSPPIPVWSYSAGQ